MADSKKSPRSKQPPAKTLEAREQQMVALSYDVAEEQLRNGTAPAQVVTHFLKIGTVREQLEREKISYETELLQARKENIDSLARQEDLFAEAIGAMKSYQGQDDTVLDD